MLQAARTTARSGTSAVLSQAPIFSKKEPSKGEGGCLTASPGRTRKLVVISFTAVLAQIVPLTGVWIRAPQQLMMTGGKPAVEGACLLVHVTSMQKPRASARWLEQNRSGVMVVQFRSKPAVHHYQRPHLIMMVCSHCPRLMRQEASSQHIKHHRSGSAQQAESSSKTGSITRAGGSGAPHPADSRALGMHSRLQPHPSPHPVLLSAMAVS
jgi:hypothetical protein